MKISELIQISFARTGALLLKPFSWRKWVRLTFIALLAGSLVGNGISPLNSLSNSSRSERIKSRLAAQTTEQKAEPVSRRAQIKAALVKAKNFAAEHRLPAAAAAAGFLILVLLLSLLSSRFDLVWTHAVAGNTAAIKEPFARYRAEGYSLFAARMALVALSWPILIAIGWWCWRLYLRVSAGGWQIREVLSSFWLPGLMTLSVLLIFAVIGFVIHHFIIPVMMLERSRFMAAAGRATAVLGSHKTDVFMYIIAVILSRMVWGFAAVAIMIAAVLIFTLLALIVGAPLYLLLVTTAKAKLLFIIVIAVIGVPAVAVFIITIFMAQLPGAVFIRSYSLEWLAAADETLSRQLKHYSETNNNA